MVVRVQCSQLYTRLPGSPGDHDTKPVYGYEDSYLIDKLGNVYSIISKTNNNKPWLKSPWVDKKGCLVVGLYNGKKNNTRKVSRLMAETFFNEHRCWIEIEYKDGNKLNCALDNLSLKV